MFFWLELKVSSNPLVPFSVFTSTNAFVLSCIACGWGSFGIWVYELWTILIVLRGSSPLLASAYLSPLVISGAIAAIATGFLLERVRPAWLMVRECELVCETAMGSDSCFLGHCYVGFLDRQSAYRDCPTTSDLLGSILRDEHHSLLGNGYELRKCCVRYLASPFH